MGADMIEAETVAKPARRRRGKALEDALLDAAWTELVTTGYAGFTIEGVVARAGTSRPVIYRRWSDRRELALAAMRHRYVKRRFAVPDTGSLRGDMIALLKEVTKWRKDEVALFSMHMGEFFAETGSSFEDLRNELLAAGPRALDAVVDRAVARGEIDPEKLTPRVRNAPGDLLRQQLLTTLKPVPEKDIVSIVDEVFLPLVRPDKAS